MATDPKTRLQGQDPAKVASKHDKVEFENHRVRVLRVKYGAGATFVMHPLQIAGIELDVMDNLQGVCSCPIAVLATIRPE